MYCMYACMYVLMYILYVHSQAYWYIGTSLPQFPHILLGVREALALRTLLTTTTYM
jgi:hypothetical protein